MVMRQRSLKFASCTLLLSAEMRSESNRVRASSTKRKVRSTASPRKERALPCFAGWRRARGKSVRKPARRCSKKFTTGVKR